MSENIDNRFSSSIINWYNVHKRELPWRDTTNPYIIWISEIILQQTRVEQGYNYFMKFIQRFPTVKDLAAANEDDVLKLWQGLGYYSRARNLHATAKIVVSKYDGNFPPVYKDIISLKGVGDYTAAAILSFSYNLPYAVVDGNVYRVLSRVFGVEEPIDTTKGKKVFAELAETLLDKTKSGLYNQAIMDFGALQCVPVSPDCFICPISDFCFAFAEGKISELPKKKNKSKSRNRYFNYLDIRSENNMYLQKRLNKDIWQNLHELPLIESDVPLNKEELMKDKRFQNIFKNVTILSIKPSIQLKHVLSHQIIYASFYQIELKSKLFKHPFLSIKTQDVDNYAISRLVEKYLENLK